MSGQTNDARRQRNRERQQKFWSSKTAEERARLRLKYALNAAMKQKADGVHESIIPDALAELDADAAAIDGE